MEEFRGLSSFLECRGRLRLLFSPTSRFRLALQGPKILHLVRKKFEQFPNFQVQKAQTVDHFHKFRAEQDAQIQARKVVHLSKVDKKGKELSEKLFNGVREAADEYPFIFVFKVENMRNNYLKEVRTEFSDSRIFFGKTKVMAKALGSDSATEHLPGLCKLTPYLRGDVGLLFTSRSPDDVIDYFTTYSQTDFARAGIAATHTFTIPEGVVYTRGGEIPTDEDVPVAHSVETTIRKWGMPTKLHKGKVLLDAPYTVCKEGQILNSHQTALLKMFGVAMADFRIQLLAYWSAAGGKVETVEDPNAMET